jgi:hypothetical protein
LPRNQTRIRAPRSVERCERCFLIASRVPRAPGAEHHHRCGGLVITRRLNDLERRVLAAWFDRNGRTLPADAYPAEFRVRRWS